MEQGGLQQKLLSKDRATKNQRKRNDKERKSKVHQGKETVFSKIQRERREHYITTAPRSPKRQEMIYLTANPNQPLRLPSNHLLKLTQSQRLTNHLLHTKNPSNNHIKKLSNDILKRLEHRIPTGAKKRAEGKSRKSKSKEWDEEASEKFADEGEEVVEGHFFLLCGGVGRFALRGISCVWLGWLVGRVVKLKRHARGEMEVYLYDSGRMD